MKVSARDLGTSLRKPDPGVPGYLLFGADPMRVATMRKDLVAALAGTGAEEEMRLVWLGAADLREEPGRLLDEMTSMGFFAGPRCVVLDGAADAQAKRVEAALSAWAAGDAFLVVTAAQLGPRSALRKLFEAHPRAVATALYDDPPSREDVGRQLARAGLSEIEGDAGAALHELGRAMEPSAFRQMLERIALYKLGDTAPLTAAEVAALTPERGEADLDDLLDAAAEADLPALQASLQRMAAQGTNPVTLCIAGSRHFRTLFAVASDPGGPGQGVARVRPPLFGPRRDRIRRQAQTWGAARLEQAIRILTDTDLELRSAADLPREALIERTLIRLAMMGSR